MAKNWWFKLEWNDWLSDEKLSVCSFETQGFWMRCVCIMHRSGSFELTGTIEDLRRLLGCLPEEVSRCASELKRTGAADVRFGNGEVSIVSRRLQTEHKAKERNRLHVAKHREKDGCKDDVRIQSKSKSKSKNKKEELRVEEAPKRTATTTAKNNPDEQFLTELAESPVYKTINVVIEFERATIWCKANNRQPTRRFFIGWLNRAKPMDIGANQNGTNQKYSSNREKSAAANAGIEQFADELERKGRAERAAQIAAAEQKHLSSGNGSNSAESRLIG